MTRIVLVALAALALLSAWALAATAGRATKAAWWERTIDDIERLPVTDDEAA